MTKSEEIKEEVEKILYNVYGEGLSKAKGHNPWHWFNEQKDIFTKQIINCFAPKAQVQIGDKWLPAKEEPYYPLGIEWWECFFGIHELIQSKRYSHTKYCFRCGKRRTNPKFDY